jgi:small subunit ribosomal protein S17
VEFVAQAQTAQPGAAGKPGAATAEPRARRRTLTGLVVAARTPKTCRVQVDYLTRHRKYNKYIRRRTVLAVHDEKSEARAGDRAEIMECRPMSRTKRWRLVRVVQKAPEGFGVAIVDVEIPGTRKPEDKPAAAEGSKS